MMKRISLTVLFVALLVTYTIGQNYVLSNQSEIKFVTKHLGIFNVDGEFSEFSGKLTRTDNILSGDGKIVVSSIDTGNKSRDKDLRGKKFLDATTFTNITFQVIEAHSEGKHSEMTGTLTIKDKSLDLIFPYELVQTGRGLLIEFETVIDRTDFELYFDSLDGLVGNEVKLDCYLLFEPE